MKKLTAGIFATLLAVVSTGAANAEIASKGYVDDINTALTTAIGNKADTATVTALDTRVETAEGEIDTINTTIGGYGDVVTHNASEFATSAQGAKADTAVQPTAISDMQVKANLTTNAEWSTEKSADDKYPSNAAVDAAIKTATSGLPTSGKITEIEGNITEIQGNVTQLQTDVSAKQNKNMGAGAANHIVTTDGSGNITSSATIANTQVSGLGALATKSTVTSADITDGTIAEGDLNASINASLDKADTALQKATADAAYAVKGTEDIADGAAANAQQALTDIGTKSELTTTNKDNLVGAINELDAAMNDMATNDTIEGIQTDLTELEGKVGTNTINIGTNTTHIGTVGNLSTTAKNDLVSAVNEVKTQADKGVSDAATAKSAADAAQEAAEAAQTAAAAKIPLPTGECSNPTAKCVLVSNGTNSFEWEVIARDGEGK